jgi:hypothetical protein
VAVDFHQAYIAGGGIARLGQFFLCYPLFFADPLDVVNY